MTALGSGACALGGAPPAGGVTGDVKRIVAATVAAFVRDSGFREIGPTAGPPSRRAERNDIDNCQDNCANAGEQRSGFRAAACGS